MVPTSRSTIATDPQASGRISIIVACSRNRVIGRNGRLPWDIPEDWEYFLEQTREGTLILGRNCYEEMIERTLEGRETVVLSRNPAFQPSLGHLARSMSQALDIANDIGREIWICGGESIYREALGLADRLLLTLVDVEIQGDTFFPPWERYFRNEIARREGRDANYRYTFLVFERN